MRERIGPGKPLVLVGYSNGGALVLKYALEEVERGEDLPSTRLALISPMIGVAPFAWLARVISLLGPIPYFEKARWLDVIPEYNPFKYNSFPANAGLQSWRLTTDLQAQILRLGKAGRLKELPPVLAFQSVVDATVSTAAVVHALFDQLESNGSELVLFDINRLSGMEPFIDPAVATILSRLTDRSPRRYARSLVTNANQDSLEVVERSIHPNATEIVTRPLGLAWPPEMFSLAHIALPFTLDDDLYGRNPLPSSSDGGAAGHPQSERRARGADGSAGDADAGLVQPVLPVPGRASDGICPQREDVRRRAVTGVYFRRLGSDFLVAHLRRRNPCVRNDRLEGTS